MKGFGSLWRQTMFPMATAFPPKTPDPVPVARRFGLSLTLALLLASTGCSTFAERTLKLHNAYYDNQLAAAQAEIAECLKQNRGNVDLIQLDAAMVDLAAG